MSDQAGIPAGSDAIAPAADAPVQDTGGELSVTQAARLLAQHRNKPRDQAPVEQPQADPVEQPELAQANAGPEETPSEEPDAAEPEALPPIEPPRSWTKAEKAEWDSYPRAAQEAISRRAQDADKAIRQSQNEAAEIRKVIQAEREQAEKARKEYEAKLPSLMQALQENGPFADIRTMADVEKMQAEDPFRFQAFQLHQWKLQAAQAELTQAEQRKAEEHHTQWTEHVQKENALAAELIPELADKVKGPALTQRAADRLNELGFKPEELAALASGKEKLSLYDHRIQRLIFSDLKLSEIQSAKTAVAAKPVPPVQRPGTAKPQGNASSERLQALTDKFNRTGSLRDAQELRAAQMRGRA